MHMRTIILAIVPAVVLVFAGISRTYSQSFVADTLAGQVAAWKDVRIYHQQDVQTRQLLKGATHDLAALDIRAITLDAGVIMPAYPQEYDELLIVKEGVLDLSVGDEDRKLGPGGVALFAAGQKYSVEDGDSARAVYYVFRFKGRSVLNKDRAKPPFLLDWKDMVMKKTDKGESRQVFDQPVAWLGKIDMHATTLNQGEISHPPHVHRSEEIILVRSGNVRESIGGKYFSASEGDVIFLPSGVPHALENKGTGRCEYFALQWLP